LGNGLLLFGELERLDGEVGLLGPVKADDQSVELLTNLEAVRTLFVTVTAEIGPLNEARCTVISSQGP
jgi:hypothetical protein